MAMNVSRPAPGQTAGPVPEKPPVVTPQAPKAPDLQAAPAQAIELDLNQFMVDGPGLEANTRPEATISANQLNFEKLSSTIISEVKRVQSLRPDQQTFQIQVGGQTIDIDTHKLDPKLLMKALQEHFSKLSLPADLQSIQQLQDHSRSIILQIRQTPAASPETMLGAAAAAATPPLKPGQPAPDKQVAAIAKDIQKQVPEKTRQAFDLSPEALKTWSETGQIPAGLQKLSQAYGKEHQALFQPLLLAVSYGKAVIASQLQAGKITPAQAAEATGKLDEIKSAAAKKWESLNASAVGDSRKVADQAFQNWKKAEQKVVELNKSLAGKTELSAGEQSQLAAARAEAAQLLQKHQKAQKVALEAASAMKDVRVHRVEVNGGEDAPLPMREKAAKAILDAATTEVAVGKQKVGVQQLQQQARDAALETPGPDGGKPEPAPPQLLTAEELPENLYRARDLVEAAEFMLPEWQSNQTVISQRQGVLEAQQDAMRPFVTDLEKAKHLEDQRAQLQEKLKALPPVEGSQPDDLAKRAKILKEIEAVEQKLAGDHLPQDDAGTAIRPAEQRLVRLQAQSIARLQESYAADIALNQVANPTADQQARVREAAAKSRNLYLESANVGQDGLDAGLHQAQMDEEASQWQQFGRKDAQQQIDLASQRLLDLPEKPSPEREQQRKDAEIALAAAVQFMRTQEARFAKPAPSPSDQLAALRSETQAQALGMGPARLAQASEAAAVARHTTVGTTYKPGDPAWLKDNGGFVRDHAQLNKRSYDRAVSQANLQRLHDQGAQRLDTTHKEELKAVNKALSELPPIGKGTPTEAAQRRKLEASKAALKEQISNFEATDAGKAGVDAADLYRRTALLDGPLTQLEKRQAEQANNVALAKQKVGTSKTPQTPADLDNWRTLIEVNLAAAENPAFDSPGVAADYLKETNERMAQLPPAMRQALSEDVKQRAFAIYKAYVESNHSGAPGKTAELAEQVEAAINPPGSPKGVDKVQQEWAKFQQQSDPTRLFAQHRKELESALVSLQAQVAGDIEAQFNLAVEHGGFAVGTVARIARSKMKDGDIEGAKKILADAVNKALQEADQAEKEYKALPPAKQEHYRAILRSGASPEAKQEALEQVFGYANDGTEVANRRAERNAGLALRLAESSQTMSRANAAGSEYDYSKNAQATADLLQDRTSGVRPRGGQAAEAYASRQAHQREKDERYWKDPAIAVMTTLVDEAFMAVVTLGTSTAFSLAKGALTGAEAVKTAYDASRIGKAVMRGSEWVASGNRYVRNGLAHIDGLLMNGSRFSQTMGLGFRFGRSVARNIAMEQSVKGMAYVAEKVGGKDTWLTWAAEAAGKGMGMQIAEIKGLAMIETSAWSVVESASSQLLLPSLYPNNPDGLKNAQEGFHYLMMGLQTLHGMHRMQSEASLVGGMEAQGMIHDLQAKGQVLEPHEQKAIHDQVVKYQEALKHNQGVLDPKAHETLLKGIEAALPHASGETLNQVRETVKLYLQPYRMQVATASIGAENFDVAKADPATVKKTLTALAAEVQKQGLASSPQEALHLATGQLVGKYLTSQTPEGFDWHKVTPEGQASMREHLEKAAQRLQDLGLVNNPIQAMALAKADMKQRMQDAIQGVDLRSPDGKAVQAAFVENFAQLEKFTAAWQHASAAVVGLSGPQAQSVRKGIQELLLKPGEGPLLPQITQKVSEILGQGADTQAKAAAMATDTCVRWTNEVLMREQAGGAYPNAKPLDWHDRQVVMLTSMGVHPSTAEAVALASHLDKMANDYAGLGETGDQCKALSQGLHASFKQLKDTFPASPDDMLAIRKELVKKLTESGIHPEKATEIAEHMIKEGFEVVRHIQPHPLTREKVVLPVGKQLDDSAHMMKFYEQMGGWNQIRGLKGKIPDEVFFKLSEIRDQKVEAYWQEVQAEASKLGVELKNPPYVGRGPGMPGYTGAFADIDVVVRVTGFTDKQPHSVAEIASKELILKQIMQKKLNDLVPAAGHMLDVNVYVTPQFLKIAHPDGQKVAPELLRENQLNELHIDFYQIRQGFGEHGHAQWQAFQEQALSKAGKEDAKAMKEYAQAVADGKHPPLPVSAVAQLKEGFAWTDKAFHDYHEAVNSVLVQLKADPANHRQSEAVLAEQARDTVRVGLESQLAKFLNDHKDVLEANTEAGARARVEYNRLQMELRAASPEAYAGNAAVEWGSRGGAEQKAFLSSLAQNNEAGLSGRVSHAQYILHYAVEATDLPVEMRAWKAGKYDLRDALFLDSVQAKGTLTREVDNPVYLWMERQKAKNPDFEWDPTVPAKIQEPVHETTISDMRDNLEKYVPVKENKAYKPTDPNSGPPQLPLGPDDDPRLEVENNDIFKRKKVPVNKMDQAALDARTNAKGPEEALKIWADPKYFGKEGNTQEANEALARTAMKDYLNMLAMTVQDTSAMHLMTAGRQ